MKKHSEKYTLEKIESVSKKLRSLPPVEKSKQSLSKQETVKILAKEIANLKKRGYTLDQISELLRGEGLDFATPTLKNYLQRVNDGKSKRKVSDKRSEKSGSKSVILKDTSDQKKAEFSPKPDSEKL
ncbi:MAG: protein mobC [Alphaproteobacteria bacterium]